MQVVEGRNLAARDFSLLGTASSDPYVIVSLNNSEIARTEILYKTLNPRWAMQPVEIPILDMKAAVLTFLW